MLQASQRLNSDHDHHCTDNVTANKVEATQYECGNDRATKIERPSNQKQLVPTWTKRIGNVTAAENDENGQRLGQGGQVANLFNVESLYIAQVLGKEQNRAVDNVQVSRVRHPTRRQWQWGEEIDHWWYFSLALVSCLFNARLNNECFLMFTDQFVLFWRVGDETEIF